VKALILAAGRGERMRPLTDRMPKPLLELAGKPLIVWQIERLRRAGIRDLVVNLGWLGDRLADALGDGSRWDARIVYSREPEQAWETGGAVATALPLLGGADAPPFAVLSADIYTEFDYARLHEAAASIAADPRATSAHFVLADNPPHHPGGDMALDAGGRVRREGVKLNYGNIAVFHAGLFAGRPARQAWKLFPWLYAEVDAGRVSGEHWRGAWHNVGTPEQLAELDARLRADATDLSPALRRGLARG
jgi:MurNAc alpha-1-phosphate uridylyltransferase